ILSSVLRKKIEQINPEQTKLIEQIQDNTLQLYNGTRDILWSLDPKHDNLLELSQRFQFIGEEFFKESGINFSVKGITPSLATIKIGMDQGRNFTMIFKEAMNNIVKYAAATEVTVTVKQQTDHDFELVIQDNGKGFDLKNYKAGNGIFNMKQRAERIN